VFRVGPELAPGDFAWHRADETLRREFWRAAVAYVLKVKDASLARGLDRDGRRLKPIKPSTRRNRKSAMGPADPNAPPLTPSFGASRTRLYLTGRALADGAEFYWRAGWGRILAIHAAGSRKRGLPKRDVIGLSPADTREAARLLAGWWRARVERDERPTLLPVPPPPKGPLPVLGRTDYDRFTYGIGTKGTQAEAVAEAKRLHAAGRSTGFFQFKPPGGYKAEPPLPPPPNPRKPGGAKAAARAGVKRRKKVG
jgi:hypothetical protein